MSDGLLGKDKQTDVLDFAGKTKKRDHYLKSAHSTEKSKSPLKNLLGLKKKKKKGDDFNIDEFPDTGKPIEAGKESAEWNAFKEMQDRISANVQKTQQNLTKLEKSTSVCEGSVDVQVPGPSTNWEQFGDEEEEDKPETITELQSEAKPEEHSPNLPISDNLAHLTVTPVPSPAHQPDPPQNTPSRTGAHDTVTNGATSDHLGLNSDKAEETPQKDMSAVDDLLGLDVLASPIKPDVPDSGLSSGIVSPTNPNNVDPFALDDIPNQGASVSNQIVDDFLGLGLESAPAPAPTTKAAAPPIPVPSPAKISSTTSSASSTPRRGSKGPKPPRPPPPRRASKGSFSMTSVDDSTFDPIVPVSVPATTASVPVLKRPENPFKVSTTEAETNGDLYFGSSKASADDDIFKVPDISEVLQSTEITEGIDGKPKVQLKADAVPKVEPMTSNNPFANMDTSEPVNVSTGFDIFGGEAPIQPDTLPVIDVRIRTASEHSSQEDDNFDPRGAGDASFDVTPVTGDKDVWAAAPAGEDQTDGFFAAFSEMSKNDTTNQTDGNIEIVQETKPSKEAAAVAFPEALFGDSSTDAFFTQVQEEPISTNPFATEGASTNPFADTGEIVVSNADPPDFDAIFGAEEVASAFKAVGGRSGSDGQLGVFDPFQTIHPTSSEEHPHGLGTISDDEDEKIVVTIKDSSTPRPHGTAVAPAPLLPPPPKSDNPPRFNPFDKEESSPEEDGFPGFPPVKSETQNEQQSTTADTTEVKPIPVRTASEEREEEEMQLPAVSDDFHPAFKDDGWSMMIRQPQKKRLTQQRYWKQCYVRLVSHETGFSIKIYENEETKVSFQELLLQPSYALADEELQQYDAFGKIHTIKITYVFFKERVGLKAERMTPANLQRLIKKPSATMILDHSPQVSEIMKLGCLHQDVMKSFIWEIENTMMKIIALRERTLTYAKDEVSMEVWDEYENELDTKGHIVWQRARVRCFALTFITGMPTLELGINDLRRKGKEIVGRHDIIPVRCDEWIRLQLPEFHACVDQEEFTKSNMIKFKPLDACQFELFRFRISLRPNWELPLQIRAEQNISKTRVEIRADILIPGYYSSSSKDGQVPCEDIQIRFPIPECWIYLFRVEKRWGYGSVKSTTRKPGRIKGLERITMMAQGGASPSLIEVGVGSAKYEHIYRSVVWRIPRLPERHHGAYKTHLFMCRIDLGPHDEVPEVYEKYAHVHYNMPNSTVSRTAIRSISADTCDPPEKWVRYIGKYRYKVEIDHTINIEDEPDNGIDDNMPVQQVGYAISSVPREEEPRSASSDRELTEPRAPRPPTPDEEPPLVHSEPAAQTTDTLIAVDSLIAVDPVAAPIPAAEPAADSVSTLDQLDPLADTAVFDQNSSNEGGLMDLMAPPPTTLLGASSDEEDLK